MAFPRRTRLVHFDEKLNGLGAEDLAQDWYAEAVKVLRGGDGGEHGQLLYKLACRLPMRGGRIVALDVGTARGFSALVMAKAFADSKVAGKVYTLDTVGHHEAKDWHGVKHDSDDPLAGSTWSRDEIWHRWYEREGDAVTVIAGRSTDVLATWEHGEIDIAFLDGSHAFEDVSQELTLLDSLTSDVGIVVLDDYHVGEVVGRVRSRLLNAITWCTRRALGSAGARLAARPGESTEYRLVKQRFVGVRRAVDEFIGSRNNRWSMEIVRMPTRGSYQGPDYSLVVLSRRMDRESGGRGVPDADALSLHGA